MDASIRRFRLKRIIPTRRFSSGQVNRWLLLLAMILTFALDGLTIRSAAAQSADPLPIGEDAHLTTSLAWGDWDGDGDLDLAVGNNGVNRLFQNNGGSSLSLVWQSSEVRFTRSLAWGDWDDDGDLDLAVGNDLEPNQVYRNESGTLTLAWESGEHDKRTSSVVWGDWDGDGDLDLAVGNRGQANQIFQNDNGLLSLDWEAAAVQDTTSIDWDDWDGDGDLDLAVGNFNQPNQLYRNEGGSLSLVWESPAADATTSLAWGDWDDDGDPDLAVGNQGQANQLFQNDDGSLQSVWSSFDAQETRQVAWGDWNGDGDLDLAVANAEQPNQIHENENQTLNLGWQSTGEAHETHSIAWADWDSDGDLDLAAGNFLDLNLLYDASPQTVSVQSRTVEPLATEDAWDGHVWQPVPHSSHTFKAPAGAVRVSVQAQWKWSGRQDLPDQLNETHNTLLPGGRVIECDDMGDKELDQDGDGLGDAWLNCGGPLVFDWSGSLPVEVVFTGDDSSRGSHLFKVVIRWTTAIAPPQCLSVSTTPPKNSRISKDGTQAQIVVNAQNATQYRIVEANTNQPIAIKARAQASHIFNQVQVMPNVPYQAQASGRDGIWSTQGCGFSYNLLSIPPSGTATCSGGSIINPNPFPIQATYSIGGVVIFDDTVAAGETIPVTYTYNDGATHTAQLTWSGNGESGTINLGTFQCGSPSGTADCVGGSITNPNNFAIQADYTIDGISVFSGSVAAMTTVPVPYTYSDGVSHTARLSWSGNGLSGTLDLGSFQCGPPSGTASCIGGSITNPNSFPINVDYRVDGVSQFSGTVAPGATADVNYTFADGLTHTAELIWSGGGLNGTVNLGSFQCSQPGGTATCAGGSIINPNPFPIQAVYRVDGLVIFSGQVPAQSTVPVSFNFNDAATHNAEFSWSGGGLSGTVDLGSFQCNTPSGTASCSGGTVSNPFAFPIQIEYRVDGEVVFAGSVPAQSTIDISYSFKDTRSHEAEFSWSGNDLSGTVDLGSFGPCRTVSSQYQGFIGPVALGNDPPSLEAGKEYFAGPRSVMVNVEYLTDDMQGDVVFRFNGQELSDITTSIFNNGTYRQVDSANGRAVTTFDDGISKLIAYRYGVERGRIFQAVHNPTSRWIHPLDQPFEYKPGFSLTLYGPPQATDRLIYQDLQTDIQYDASGQATIDLQYAAPGLVAAYSLADDDSLAWQTVALLRPAITRTQTIDYTFSEMGLYHYRVIDGAGNVLADPAPDSSLSFDAQPGMTYQAQLVYPESSLFVALYDDMQFQHPTGWRMPIDASQEQVMEFHLDYHRQDDPDLGDDHVRGDVVVDALYLLNGTTSVAQQFPYGRHDGLLPGVTIIGIPNVSMVAFCGRPGVHEVAYWGGWENESYYLPNNGIVFDEEGHESWTEEQRRDCVDAANRVNMILAREGLRTNHTFRHHGVESQGYQMAMQGLWSPYNLVDMRPPHLGQLLKPGTVLKYYEAVEDQLFWGWSLEKGGLLDGLDAQKLRQHVASLGPITYIDQTGIHPPLALSR